jgi:hypothetical protein
MLKSHALPTDPPHPARPGSDDARAIATMHNIHSHHTSSLRAQQAWELIGGLDFKLYMCFNQTCKTEHALFGRSVRFRLFDKPHIRPRKVHYKADSGPDGALAKCFWHPFPVSVVRVEVCDYRAGMGIAAILASILRSYRYTKQDIVKKSLYSGAQRRNNADV